MTIALRLLLLVLALALSAAGGSSREPAVVDGPTHNGVEVAIDLPPSEHVRNFGAPSDGAGLCVFASLDMAARWHHVETLIDVIHKLQEGGGWPQKVDATIKGLSPETRYEQYEGTDPAILDAAIARRAPACVTYGTGERYGMQTIYHMVILLHIDKQYACILDNNFPGTYEWMSRKEFLARWLHPAGKGWAVVLLEAPPPPIPRSLGR